MRHCVLVLLFSFRVHSNTAERQETPPPPTTHIPLHSRLCNYDRCRPASPTVLRALPGINSWCVKEVTHHHYAGRGEDGDGDEDEVVGGGINWCSCWKHSECLTLKVPRSQFLGVSPGGAQNSPSLLLRRRYCSAWMRACKWVHKKQSVLSIRLCLLSGRAELLAPLRACVVMIRRQSNTCFKHNPILPVASGFSVAFPFCVGHWFKNYLTWFDSVNKKPLVTLRGWWGAFYYHLETPQMRQKCNVETWQVCFEPVDL